MTRWTNPQADRICYNNGVSADSWFSYRALMSIKPFTVLSIQLAFSLIFFAFTIRVFERQIDG